LIIDENNYEEENGYKEEDSYKRVCKVSELKEKWGKKFFIEDLEVALFKVDGKIYALSNICPHQHASIIYDGFIEEGYIVCPAHGWEFSLETGKMKTGSRGLDSFPVKIIEDEVYIQIVKKELRW
jgi:NAD(P)H-dependent nitrite reductase small subunit